MVFEANTHHETDHTMCKVLKMVFFHEYHFVSGHLGVLKDVIPSHFEQMRVKGFGFLFILCLAPETLHSSSDKERRESFNFSHITIFDELLLPVQTFLSGERKIQFKLQLEKKTSCKHKGKNDF